MNQVKARKGRYHHGDLRRELIETAVRMLPEPGVEGLSMRQLAVKAGVSHNAPYMHFSSKDALLTAIAQFGFEQLRASLVQDHPGDWEAQLIAGCQRYVDFGISNPALFQVMFMEREEQNHPEFVEVSLSALQTLTDMILAGQAEGEVRAGDAHEFATLIWSLLHGVAVLFSNRDRAPLPYRTGDTHELTAGFLRQMLAGLRPR